MNQVQDLFRSERKDWIDDCRAVARRLLTARLDINIEDVLAVCPRPSYIHKNTCGQVFKHPDFKHCGWVQARKVSSNGRWIMRWTLSNPLPPSLRQLRRARQQEMSE